MTLNPEDTIRTAGESLAFLSPLIIGVNVGLGTIVLITFCVEFFFLVTKIRNRCHHLMKKVKQANRLIKENLSPSVEDFLAVIADAGITEEHAKDVYTSYDSRRRKVAEKILKFNLPALQEISLFKTFLCESNFIKGAGFRMHRLLHEGRMNAFSDDEEGMTMLAPPFEPISAPIKKATESTMGVSAKKTPPKKSPASTKTQQK